MHNQHVIKNKDKELILRKKEQPKCSIKNMTSCILFCNAKKKKWSVLILDYNNYCQKIIYIIYQQIGFYE